jgi:hypothetical protein
MNKKLAIIFFLLSSLFIGGYFIFKYYITNLMG